jgi:hypothetical protein
MEDISRPLFYSSSEDNAKKARRKKKGKMGEEP